MPYFKKSPWIIHYDGSSCNGCDIEVLACLTPVYDVERLGIINTGNPKHADIFLVTGSINEQNREVVQNIYEQMPDPKVVVAIGICATSGGIFAECYNVMGGVNKVLPVDVYVPGCAARPEAIIDGISAAIKILDEKRKRTKEIQSGKVPLLIEPAVLSDAPQILDLQRLAYQSEAELYNDFTLSPLRQTLEELQKDFESNLFLKAIMDGKIIGAVRAYEAKGTCFIDRLVVHPQYQNFGVGSKLINEIELRFPVCRRFESFSGHKSKRNIDFYTRHGYKKFKSEKVSEKRDRIYLEKNKTEEKQ